MFTNDDELWREVAKARRDDAQRWMQQERQLKDAGPGRVSRSRAVTTLAETLAAVFLAVARKFLAT